MNFEHPIGCLRLALWCPMMSRRKAVAGAGGGGKSWRRTQAPEPRLKAWVTKRKYGKLFGNALRTNSQKQQAPQYKPFCSSIQTNDWSFIKPNVSDGASVFLAEVNAQIARGEPWRAIWTAEDAGALRRFLKNDRRVTIKTRVDEG